jgi:hypothetical protein
MSDPQHFGLGELGQRVQAMSDPVPVPAKPPAASSQTGTQSPNPAAPPADPRLRPYQGPPLPIGSLSGRGPLPSYEPREDLRTPAPTAAPSNFAPPPPPATSQFSPAATPQPYPATSQPFTPSTLRPFEPANKTPPASSWEQVSIPAQHSDSAQTVAEGSDAATGSQPNSASSAPASPAAPVEPAKSGFQRAFDMVRSAIPIVQKLLPLLDGNFATTMGALMAPQHHPAPPPVQVDLEPVERGLAEVRNSNRELRTQVVEQSATLKRVEDQLDRVREATDRNTLEQQELVEDLRAVGNRIGTFAMIGLILLLISLGLNGYLIYQLQHILR